MIRIAQQIFFSLLLMFLGFCGGTYLGSFFVPAGSGLEGSPVALGYGFTGLIIGLVAAVILVRTMKYSMFKNTFIIVIILSLITCGWIIYRVKLLSDQQTGRKEFGSLHIAVFMKPAYTLESAGPIPIIMDEGGINPGAVAFYLLGKDVVTIYRMFFQRTAKQKLLL